MKKYSSKNINTKINEKIRRIFKENYYRIIKQALRFDRISDSEGTTELRVHRL